MTIENVHISRIDRLACLALKNGTKDWVATISTCCCNLCHFKPLSTRTYDALQVIPDQFLGVRSMPNAFPAHRTRFRHDKSSTEVASGGIRRPKIRLDFLGVLLDFNFSPALTLLTYAD